MELRNPTLKEKAFDRLWDMLMGALECDDEGLSWLFDLEYKMILKDGWTRSGGFLIPCPEEAERRFVAAMDDYVEQVSCRVS